MKKKKKKLGFKEVVSSKKVLSIIFFLLLILVIVLIILCVIKTKNDKYVAANIVIPVFEENTNFEFSLDAKSLSELNEYIFKIVNYRKNKINKDKIKYQIEVVNNTDSLLEVKIDDQGKNLMTNQQDSIFDEVTLSNEEKESIYYYVKLKDIKNLKKDDLIYIRVFN